MISKIFISSILAILMIATSSATFAIAQDQIKLTSRAEVEQVRTGPNGEQVVILFPAVKVLPGEVVVFTNTFTNPGKEPATNVVVENAVPEHMTLVDDSIFGDNSEITYSIDDGKSYEKPENLMVSDSSGRMWPAEARDYTHIRWTLQKDLAPGHTGEVGFKARIN